LNQTVINSITSYGYLRQEDILYPWLDKENYFVDYVSQQTVIPAEAVHNDTGVVNTKKQAKKTTVKQAKPTSVETTIAKPIGVMRPPKKKYD
jgi:hypothetical protein